ncbi:MAG: leucyl aminopeptidase [Nitrospinae bacterium CG11_big_fil_rev_8_21_14_0_20_45_15]|nr:MAG: leucyl aminopeptidase [Nitrospinae bacterium CG11_big_fil_rev_8_21_14_0_20_45_15]
MKPIKIKTDAFISHNTDCLTLFRPEEEKPDATLKEIDQKLNGAISSAYKNKRFEGKANQTLWLDTLGNIKPKAILLVGLGPDKEVTAEKLRQASATALKQIEKNKTTSLSLAVPDLTGDKKNNLKIEPEHIACALAEGALLSLYRFEEYKSKDKKSKNQNDSLEELSLLTDASNQAIARKSAQKAHKIVDAVFTARDLISHPGNRATPTFLAQTAKKVARANQFTCKILGRKEMEKFGMGALLGVSQGSTEPPALIVMEYKGGPKKQAPVVIVGKGITFDTGGISIKPSANMGEMKMDMSGGAATIGALQAAASLKLPINVVGLVPAAENMPSGNAIKPGDILKSMSGKTIEVLNTDAEGRLVLADALTYSARYKPRAVIDLATLTGACVVALGHQAGAVIGNNADLIQQLIASGETSGERLWNLPLWEEHEKAVKSDIADLKNISAPNVGAGTITAAAFLKAFVDDKTPWAHLDIAGVAWELDKPYIPKGASGFGVRLLIHYLENIS